MNEPSWQGLLGNLRFRGGMKMADTLKAYGTSEGAQKAWDTRGRGQKDRRTASGRPRDTTSLLDGDHMERKPTSWRELDQAGGMDWNKLSDKQKDALADKPMVNWAGRKPYDYHPDVVEKRNVGQKGQVARPDRLEHIAVVGHKRYYVNTEGSGYARYASRIHNFPTEAKD